MNHVASKTIAHAKPASGDTDCIRNFAWPGAPILDACAITISGGHVSVKQSASRIIDDGWCWHPMSISRSWSVTGCVRSYPWESEDGASTVALPASDDWNNPLFWVDDLRVAMWAKPEAAVGQATRGDNQPCVQIVDTTTTSRSLDERWAIDIAQRRVLNMFSDGQRLFLADETGTTAWDLASRNKVATWPGVTVRLHDAQRRVLIAVTPDRIAELSLPLGSLPCCS